jgi:hypothetical protein
MVTRLMPAPGKEARMPKAWMACISALVVRFDVLRFPTIDVLLVSAVVTVMPDHGSQRHS